MSENVELQLNSIESQASFFNPLVKQVSVGPQNVELQVKTADSLSNNSVSWRLPVSESVLVSRKIVAQIPITLDINAQTHTCQHYSACLRPDALSRILSSCTVQVNGVTIQCDPEVISLTTHQYDRDDDLLHHGGMFACAPQTPDFFHGVDMAINGAVDPDATTNAPSAYHFKSWSSDPSYPSRGAWGYTNAGGTSAAGNGQAARTTTTTLFKFALKNPLLSSSQEYLANIREMQITLTFRSNIKHRAWLTSVIEDDTDQAADGEVSGYIGTPAAAFATTGVLSQTDFKLFYYLVAPSNPDVIPIEQKIACRDFVPNEYQVGTVNNDASTVVNHVIAEHQTVPSHVFIYAVPAEASLSHYRTDVFGRITDLRLTINNQTYTLSSLTDQELYDMCCQNGLKIPFESFQTVNTRSVNQVTNTTRRGIGAPLCFKVDRDFGKSLVPGSNTGFKLQLQYTLTNNLGAALTWVSRCVFVLPSMVTIPRGGVPRHEIGISPDEVQQALTTQIKPSLPEVEFDDQIIGGSIFSSLRANKKDINTILRLLMPFLKYYAGKQIDPEFGQALMESAGLAERETYAGLMGGSRMAGANLAGAYMGGSRFLGGAMNKQQSLKAMGLAM